MNDARWRYALASVVGSSHLRRQTPCQDAGGCQIMRAGSGAPVLVAIASDGAGSAPASDTGSTLACLFFLDTVEELLARGATVDDLDREAAQNWLTRLQEEIARLAHHEQRQPRDYACTALAAVVGPERAAFFQVGDGAIVVSPPTEADEYCWVFWPQRGEYENVTMFATDPRAHDHLDHAFVDHPIDEVALLTDGLQRLALHFGDQTVFTPFFRPMFAPLRNATGGYLDSLSRGLATFLASDRVNSRTDDDKTLILASRRSATASKR